jgi:hypothetical protein
MPEKNRVFESQTILDVISQDQSLLAVSEAHKNFRKNPRKRPPFRYSRDLVMRIIARIKELEVKDAK